MEIQPRCRADEIVDTGGTITFEDIIRWFSQAKLIDGRVLSVDLLKNLFVTFKLAKISLPKFLVLVNDTGRAIKGDANVLLKRLKDSSGDLQKMMVKEGFAKLVK